MSETIRIRMTQDVRPDFPFGAIVGVKPGTILRAGQEYEATSNAHGAISGICENGESLGVKPGEFEFIEAPEELWKIHGQVEKQSAETEPPETDSFIEAIRKVAHEIDAKKMVPMGQLLKVLEEHGEYCERCEADEPTLYYDPTGATGPTVRCPYCGYSLKLDTLVKRARNLPIDYRERMIAQDAKTTFIEQIGEDVWITNGILAEIAGDIQLSYPDRKKFKPTDAISKLFEGLVMNKYNEAKLSRTVYIEKHGRQPYVSMLKVQDMPTGKTLRTVYINNDFAKYIGGIFTPYVAGLLDPVLVKDNAGKIRRIILPIRFNPAELEGAP